MSENNFVGYEYQDIAVKRSMVSVYADGYENFGWKLDKTEELSDKPMTDSVRMKFKRDRKIRNKVELTRLQRNFDACVSEILSLEASKSNKAAIAAFSVGIVGTAFMAGSVFAVTSGLVIPCILLAIPAFIGWILPYFLFQKIKKGKTAAVTPEIDKKYDELYAVCQKANGLLDGVE
ncbi:MAG: hypothetical protein Q4D16_00565 [Eubacteriales bacterium]|nr:hypothetical protein [Eubacteriales bacterium]